MKKLFLSLAMLALTVGLHAAPATEGDVFVVPTAKSIKYGKGVANITCQAEVTTSDSSLDYAAGYLKRSLHMFGAPMHGESTPIKLEIAKNKKLGNEAYILEVKEKQITISGQTPQAVLWGIQTLLQIQDAKDARGKFEIPVCKIQDEPDYRMRGFMIDVARKFIPMDYLKNLVRTMSYYKMNMLQIHLNDNGFKKYYHNNWDETYAAFRLESERFPELTAKDGHYSKDEFRRFVKESAKLGVEIIPEIDVPAHSLAFSHFRPSLCAPKFGVDHLDLTNPEVVPFVDSLFIEYMEGPDPVFAGPRVHVGTDEYSNADKQVVELFRGFTDHLIKLVESYGYQAKLWGSLSHANGETPVKSENVIMDVWNNGFANPKDMKEQGYQLVSIPDGYVYIVPAAGYYYDYLNDRFLYERWTPANIGGVQFEEKDPQIEGGCFAVWNDVCGNGISVGDVHHRTFPALQVMAEKCWHAVNDTVNYAKWDAGRKRLGEGPGINELGNTEIELPFLRSNTPLQAFAPKAPAMKMRPKHDAKNADCKDCKDKNCKDCDKNKKNDKKLDCKDCKDKNCKDCDKNKKNDKKFKNDRKNAPQQGKFAHNNKRGPQQGRFNAPMAKRGPQQGKFAHNNKRGPQQGRFNAPMAKRGGMMNFHAMGNPYAQIGYDYQVDFDITWGKEKPGAVLTESARAKFYLCDPISGMIGFSRDGYLFTFKHSGRHGVKEHITIKGTNKKTELWVNGKLVETLNYDEKLAADKKPYNVVRTLVFPLWKTGQFKSKVTNFKAKKI